MSLSLLEQDSLRNQTTIPAAVMASVARRASVEAVVDGDRRVTYRELGERILAATRAMMAFGVGPGDRVAVWAPNSLGWIVAALGAQCAGAALVPINTRWKGAEAAYVLSAARVSLLCTSVGFLDTDTVAMLDADDTPLPDLRGIVLLDGSASAGPPAADAVPATEWSEFEGRGEAVPADDAQCPARRACSRPTRATSSSPPARPDGRRASS